MLSDPPTSLATRPVHRQSQDQRIHIYVDREAKALCVEPRGSLDAVTQAELVVAFVPSRGPAALIVRGAAHICARRGWKQTGRWTEDSPADVHITMVKTRS